MPQARHIDNVLATEHSVGVAGVIGLRTFIAMMDVKIIDLRAELEIFEEDGSHGKPAGIVPRHHITGVYMEQAPTPSISHQSAFDYCN